LLNTQPLYDALLAIQSRWGKDVSQQVMHDFRLSQQVRAVNLSIQSMKLGGVGIPDGPEKERFNDIRMKLASLSTSFSNNVMDETKAFALTIDDPNKLDGVPESAKAMWAATHYAFIAKENTNINADEASSVPPMDPNKGPWRITLDMPSYIGE
jgi:oligopeptidase A